jgi:hypothetical protein
MVYTDSAQVSAGWLGGSAECGGQLSRDNHVNARGLNVVEESRCDPNGLQKFRAHK